MNARAERSTRRDSWQETVGAPPVLSVCRVKTSWSVYTHAHRRVVCVCVRWRSEFFFTHRPRDGRQRLEFSCRTTSRPTSRLAQQHYRRLFLWLFSPVKRRFSEIRTTKYKTRNPVSSVGPPPLKSSDDASRIIIIVIERRARQLGGLRTVDPIPADAAGYQGHGPRPKHSPRLRVCVSV